jgi:hypothetical protein
MIFGVALCLVLLPSTLAQCDCTQGSIGLDLTLLVDIDSASLANQQPNGLQPLDFVRCCRLPSKFSCAISGQELLETAAV